MTTHLSTVLLDTPPPTPSILYHRETSIPSHHPSSSTRKPLGNNSRPLIHIPIKLKYPALTQTHVCACPKLTIPPPITERFSPNRRKQKLIFPVVYVCHKLALTVSCNNLYPLPRPLLLLFAGPSVHPLPPSAQNIFMSPLSLGNFPQNLLPLPLTPSLAVKH